MYAIPGQHDLPNHNYGEIGRSAYWTMVEAGVIRNLELNKPTKIPIKIDVDNKITQFLWLWGFPWGSSKFPHPKATDDIKLAVIHAFCWTEDGFVPYASSETSVNSWAKRLCGFDAVVFGDCHGGFHREISYCAIFNSGTFMRRTSDEVDYEPRVGLLHQDGTIEQHFLDCRNDVFSITEKREERESLDISGLVEELSTMAEGAVDFAESLERYCKENGVDGDVRAIIERAMGDGR